MPGQKGKIVVTQGQPPKDAELMDVVEETEPWCVYKLADGTTVKAKTVVAEIWKVDNEYDSDNNPVYVLRGNPMLSVIAPPELKRKVN